MAIFTVVPFSTMIIFSIALVISILIQCLNRVLISRLVGWKEYLSMQKEMKEYQSETMKAARSNDTKQMEKLKKRQPQINAMQQKMMKPQFVLMGVSLFSLVLWWLVLLPTFGTTPVAYLPGYGGLILTYWYFICSLFLSTLSTRILGTNPIVLPT